MYFVAWGVLERRLILKETLNICNENPSIIV